MKQERTTNGHQYRWPADRAARVQTDNTNEQVMRHRFAALGLEENLCKECRKCVRECPFDLPIPERLKEAFEAFAG